MKKILITGGTGLIGKEVVNQMSNKDYKIAVLTRGKTEIKKGIQFYHWDPEKNEIHQDALKGSHHIIHLAGANLASGRWTKKRKRKIIDSRVSSTRLLIEEIIKNNLQPESFISSSAVGYYGMDDPQTEFWETDPPGTDFLAKVCQQWEKALEPLSKLNIRTVSIRTGLVLSPDGGLLKKIIPLAKKGLNTSFGNGQQIYPWIHIEDIARIYVFAMENNKFRNAYNAAVAVEQQVSQKSFNNQLAKMLNKPNFMPNVPSFLIKLILGKMSGMLLSGSYISNEKLLSEDFKFNYKELNIALKDLLK